MCSQSYSYTLSVPPTLDGEGRCPLCGKGLGPKPRTLYGHLVCKKCSNAFATRRQVAYVLDVFAILGCWTAPLWLLLSLLFNLEPKNDAMLVSYGLFMLFKDGFSGYSIGKKLMGVRVLNKTTGKPAGFLESIERNLPLLIPLVPFLVFVEIYKKGTRLGDQWADTIVVWNKYAENKVFRVGVGPGR